MEQYEIPPQGCNKVIQLALKYFEPERLFIRSTHEPTSCRGKTKVNEILTGKKMKVKYSHSGFEFFINGKSYFLFKFSKTSAIPNFTWGKKWSLAYERFKYKSGTPVRWYASTGYPYPGEIYVGPDDPRLPEVESTMLRSVNDGHLAEITFGGKIPIIKTGKSMNGKWPPYYIIDISRIPKEPRKQ